MRDDARRPSSAYQSSESEPSRTLTDTSIHRAGDVCMYMYSYIHTRARTNEMMNDRCCESRFLSLDTICTIRAVMRKDEHSPLRYVPFCCALQCVTSRRSAPPSLLRDRGSRRNVGPVYRGRDMYEGRWHRSHEPRLTTSGGRDRQTGRPARR